MTQQQHLYKDVAFDLIEKIKMGFYASGDKLPSIREMCENFSISYVTAHRAQDFIERSGIAYKIKGKGVFVNITDNENLNSIHTDISKVRNIVCFTANEYHRDRQFDSSYMMFRGVQDEAHKTRIDLRSGFTNIGDSSPALNVKEDERIIIISDNSTKHVLPLLVNPRLKTIFVNNVFSNTYCVLNDNYSGISQLLDFMESKNKKNIVLATKFFGYLGIANLSERIYAFENEIKRRKLSGKVLRDGNYNELLNMTMAKDGPDAVMFTNDEPAIKFKKMLKENNISREVLVTGFDACGGSDSTYDSLTTVKVDYEGLGRQATKLALDLDLQDWSRPEIIRVPCEIIIKD